jgi:lysozyme
MNLQQLYIDLKEDEGKRLKPYRCPANKLSIGYGRNLEDNGISLDEAEYLLRNDIKRTETELKNALPFYIKLDDVRQNVLINMAFNLGVPRLLKFKKTLAYIQDFEFEKASKEMLVSKWHRDFVRWNGGRDTNKLRSRKLSKLMKEGKY